MSELKEWILVYLKNRDLYEGTIKAFENCTGYAFVIKRDSGNTFYLVQPELHASGEIFEKGQGKKLCVITLNTKKNVKFLLDNWNSFKHLKELCFYFVNPETNEKWIVYPFTHDLITEKAALKKGLEGLFASIPSAKA